MAENIRRGPGRPRKNENGIGHNSEPGGLIDVSALADYVERIEAIEADRKVLSDDIKDVYEEAKNAGFVTKILRQLVRERRLEDGERRNHYVLMDAYRNALGMLADTPLGQASLRGAGFDDDRPAA